MNRQRKFQEAFKHEHEVVLDHLLDLRKAVRKVDVARVAELTEAMDRVMGPHFRVEEEGLYPMLVDYLGAENVRDLIDEHVGAVAAMHAFKEHRGDREWLRTNGPAAITRMLDELMMHVSSCDGLAIIVDRFSEEQREELADHLERVQREPAPLTEWRPAPAAAPAQR